MNANPAIKVTASSSNLRGVFWRVFAAVFVTVMITGTAITFVMPEMYASTARIKVERDDLNPTPFSGTNVPSYYDPYFIQTTFEVIQSELVLSNVISDLNLNVEWGKKFFAGATLKTSDTLEILKRRLSLAPVRGTKLIAITVYSDDKNEAARIANTIAKFYHDYRETLAISQRKKRVEALSEAYQQEETEIQAARAQPDANKLAQLLDAHKRLFNKLEEAKLEEAKLEIDQKHQPCRMMTDFAEPGKYPVRPNKPLCLALTLAMATVLGTLSGGVAVWLARRQENAMG